MYKQSHITARSGIVGIERKMQEKMENTASNISVAFQDLKNLMDMAKDMVRLANIISLKIKVSISKFLSSFFSSERV